MLFLPLLALLQSAIADTFIPYTNAQGQTIYLLDDRRPALYTQSFGDCLGQSQSLIDVSRFDAELYIDNMTVSFHISGTTNLVKESVMGKPG
jgi:ML-like domain